MIEQIRRCLSSPFKPPSLVAPMKKLTTWVDDDIGTHNDLLTLAKMVLVEEADTVDTGIIDKRGNPVYRLRRPHVVGLFDFNKGR